MTLAGALACLSSALLWAVALTLFRGPIAEHGARQINLAKCTLAAVLQGVTVLALGQAGEISAASSASLAFLAASGIVGLTLGDTALLAAVARIGVHRTLLLQTLAPVFTALIAWLWQGSVPTGGQACGAIAILAGVALVVTPERTAENRTVTAPCRRWIAPGVLLGGLAALGQGSGVVLAKVGMEDVSFGPASFVRLAASAAGLIALAAVTGRLGRVTRLAESRSTATRVLPATLIGTYFAMFLMMAGIAYVPAAIAAVLLSTSPVFSLVIDALVERRAPSRRGIAGTLLAVAGVAVLSAS